MSISIVVPKKFRAKLGFLLLRIYLKLILLFQKQIFKIIRKNSNILFYSFLDDFREKYKNDDIDFRVNLASAVLNRLLPYGSADIGSPLGANEIFVSFESDRFIRIPKVREYILNHYRLRALAYSYHNKEQSEQILQSAKAIETTVEPLTLKAYNKLKKQISKDHRKAFKIHKRNLEIKKEQIKASKRRKVTLSLRDIKTTLGFASFLFLLSGYIYNRIFLGYFGIEVSKFFTLNDYISTSIDKISSILITLIVSLLINSFWWSPAYIESRRQMAKARFFFEDAPFFFAILALVLATINSWYFNLPGKYHTLGLLVFIVLLDFILRISKYFENPFLFHIIVSYLALFFVNLIAGTLDDREAILKYNTKSDSRYIARFDPTLNVKEDDLLLLDSNSNYSFFYSKSQKQAYVIPNKQIRFIERNTSAKKGILDFF